MDDETMTLIWVVVGAVLGLAAMYGVIRLAVSHAMRDRMLWQHDGSMERELAARAGERAFTDRMSGGAPSA